MNLDTTFAIATQVIARTIGGETVILDLESGTYFGLDPVGARIWQLLEGGKSLAQACDVMVEEYDVTRDVIERDALTLAGQLVASKLITVA